MPWASTLRFGACRRIASRSISSQRAPAASPGRTMVCSCHSIRQRVVSLILALLSAFMRVPSWAGAIAIDLLPAVLVLIVAVTQHAIRGGKSQLTIEHPMTVAEMRAAVAAARELDEEFDAAAQRPMPLTEPVKPRGKSR